MERPPPKCQQSQLLDNAAVAICMTTLLHFVLAGLSVSARQQVSSQSPRFCLKKNLEFGSTLTDLQVAQSPGAAASTLHTLKGHDVL